MTTVRFPNVRLGVRSSSMTADPPAGSDMTSRLRLEWLTDEVAARFWAKVDQSAGPDLCWPWQGRVNGAGYGRITLHRLGHQAHRVAYAIANGHLVDGLEVCHRCDNPPCVNPAHLFLGTRRDNATDSVAKGRHYFASRTHCPKGHPYSGPNLILAGPGRRLCRQCALSTLRAHDFIPGSHGGRRCAKCTCVESAPRHHGVDAALPIGAA